MTGASKSAKPNAVREVRELRASTPFVARTLKRFSLFIIVCACWQEGSSAVAGSARCEALPGGNRLVTVAAVIWWW